MCDVCSTSSKWKSAPNTPERHAEVDAQTHQFILKYGHQVTGVISDPCFFYTVGRAVFDKPELLLTGDIESNLAMSILNTIADMENKGQIDIASFADGEPVALDPFDCLLRFVTVNPIECEMFGATNISGPDLTAYQVLWPDAQGRWPDDPDFSYGPSAQPVRAVQ